MCKISDVKYVYQLLRGREGEEGVCLFWGGGGGGGVQKFLCKDKSICHLNQTYFILTISFQCRHNFGCKVYGTAPQKYPCFDLIMSLGDMHDF